MKWVKYAGCTPAFVQENYLQDDGFRLPDKNQTVTLEEYRRGERPWGQDGVK